MALAMAPHNVRVNAIGPGSIMTDVLAAVATNKSSMSNILSRTPMGRIGDPTEVGQVSLNKGCFHHDAILLIVIMLDSRLEIIIGSHCLAVRNSRIQQVACSISRLVIEDSACAEL